MEQDNIWSYNQTIGIDSFTGSAPRLRYLVKKIKSGKRVLNIGIGNAGFEFFAQTRGIDIYSLDPDNTSIENARLRLNVGEQFQAGRVEKIPFESNYFDYVVMSEVIEHLNQEILLKGLAEVKRVLKQDGKFIGTVPSNENLGLNLTICPSCDTKFHRWGHVTSFSASTLESTLTDHFNLIVIKDVFFSEGLEDGIKRAIIGKLKSLASHLNISTYGAARNLYFEVQRKVDDLV